MWPRASSARHATGMAHPRDPLPIPWGTAGRFEKKTAACQKKFVSLHFEIMTQQDTIMQVASGTFSQATFWDTDISKIDWLRHADFVIERVFGYGTAEEQEYLLNLYGLGRIRRFADTFTPSPYNRNVASNLQKTLSHAAL